MRSASMRVPVPAVMVNTVRVSCDGKGELGILTFDISGKKLLKGAKGGIPKAVIVMVMYRFTKNDDLFGSFDYQGHTFRFKDLAMEASLKMKKK